MLHCIVAEEQYNLAYFFVKRIECTRATLTTNLPYGMCLTRLFRYVMEHYPHLDNGIYNIVDRVTRPIALKQIRKPQSDRGNPKARHFVSSSSRHHLGSFSHHDEDDEDEVLSPSALNALSKTPSNVATSASSIDYKPKSSTSSTSPSTNGYLNSPMSPPPRVPPPPPT
nr:pentatricopeptide repeat-containing protein [Tanacetum cinerariifolium]